jgi:hypothetical protein
VYVEDKTRKVRVLALQWANALPFLTITNLLIFIFVKCFFDILRQVVSSPLFSVMAGMVTEGK